MCRVQVDGNQVHFPAGSSEMIPGSTEMLLSSPPPNPAHLQHHQTSWSKKSLFF